MVDYNDSYDSQLLEMVAERCPDFKSAYNSAFSGAGSLTASQNGFGDKSCNECTHWNQGNCDIFLNYKEKYE